MIPSFLNDPVKGKRKSSVISGRRQIPTAEMNETRRVTFVRHTIERDYGRLKSWKILSGVIPYQRRDCVQEIVETLMSTENHFFITMDSDSPRRREFATRIRSSLDVTQSTVQHLLPAGRLHSDWKSAEDAQYSIRNDMDFINFTPTDIFNLSMGKFSQTKAHYYITQFRDRIKISTNPHYPNTFTFHNIPSRYSDPLTIDYKHPVTKKAESGGKNRTCIIDFSNPDPSAEPGKKLLHLYTQKQLLQM